MKIVFFGTSNVALPILERLYREAEIAAVITSPDAPVGRKQEMEESPVSVLAKELDVPTIKPIRVRNNPEFFEQLKGFNADIFVVVSYGKILPKEIIELPQHKTVNIHFSLLPTYRGSSPIQFALLSGESKTGTTIFVLDEEMDHGPILAQEECGIDPDDNFITLSEKLAQKSAQLVVSTLTRYASGELTPQPQDHTNASYTKIISKEDGKIAWDDSAQAIYNQFRAFYLWPGIWTMWNGKKVKILDCIPSLATSNNSNFGTVTEDGSVVCGGGSLLKINRLQVEGRKDMGMNEFLNGYKNFIGSKLE